MLKGFENVRKGIQDLRIKVTWFRDFYYDGKWAYGESKFFEMPEEQEDLRDFVSGISAIGGSDGVGSGLEALALAMRSDFVQECERKRHIIVLFTDTEAHAFEDYDRLVEEAVKKGCEPKMYPENMPKSIAEFYNLWQGGDINNNFIGSDSKTAKLSQRGKRLVLFAPNTYPWYNMGWELENTIHKVINGNNGECDHDLDDVIDMIVHAV